MKAFLIVMGMSLQVFPMIAQENTPPPSDLYIKFEPSELLFDYPRLGIGLEKKFIKHTIWSSFHYGWEGLNFGNKLFYFSDPFRYWGIQAGVKRRKPDGFGEYFTGLHIAFDHTSADVFDDVYYDLNDRQAILFDAATFQRDRIRLIPELGYEFFSGDQFTLEFSGGLGISWINIHYKEVENPFILNDVEPIQHRRRSQHKYAGVKWKVALAGAVKMGIRL